MSIPANQDLRVDIPEGDKRCCDFTGNGTGVPTKNRGAGQTVTRIGAGQYRVTFNENPGRFVNFDAVIPRSAIATDIKNFSIIPTNYAANFTTLSFTYDVFVFNSAGTATDFTTAQSISVSAVFARSGVS